MSAAAAKSYFTESLSREDYYLEGSEIVGRWGGRGTLQLGLDGKVDRQTFARLAENQTPDGLPLTVRTKDHRRVGYDFNFHAPKSLSLLYAHTGDERLLSAFRSAVDRTMREMEAEMKTRVRTEGAQADRVTGNLVWAEFVHFTARPVLGVSDPHLHAHCFTFNATHDGVEGRWKAGQFGDLKRDASYFEATFHARLSREVAELGYGVERTAKGWEIAGIEREVREKFSRRTEAIERAAAERGLTGEAKDRLGALTREHKERGLTWNQLQESWRSRMTPDEVRRLDDVAAHRVPTKAPEVSPEATIRYAIEHAFERSSAVPERSVLRDALRQGYGALSVEEVKDGALRAEWLRREIGGRAYVTSASVLAEEQAMLSFARDGRGRERPLGNPDRAPVDHRLSGEQQAAVSHILSSRDRVISIRGGAGTGKTTLMQEAVRGIREGGHRIEVFAPTAEASRGVLRQEGFDRADTVARLLKDSDLQARVKGQVIWIDEAGLLGSKSLAEVFRIAHEQNARVILSGDTRQHAAVERGDALRLLEARAGIRPAELTEIRRQRGEYKEAVGAIARGEVERGFDRLETLGAIREIARPEDRYAALAQDYLEARQHGRTVLAVSPTHAEADQVVQAIRATLRDAGQIGMKERQVPALANLQWTDAERRDPNRYEPGHRLIFHQNAPGFRRGERVVVSGRDEAGRLLVAGSGGKAKPLSLVAADRFQVYAERSLPLAPGDTIRATRTAGTAQGNHRVMNGALYQVRGFDRQGNIVLSNGWTLPHNFGHLAHGYCTTSHASQGKTVDRVLIAQSADSVPASSREQFYVSVSRGRESVRIYTDDREGLRSASLHSDRRLSAVELLDRPQAQAAPGLARFVERWNQLRLRLSSRAVEKGLDLVR